MLEGGRGWYNKGRRERGGGGRCVTEGGGCEEGWEGEEGRGGGGERGGSEGGRGGD